MHQCHRVVAGHGALAALVAVWLDDPRQTSFVWHSRQGLTVKSGRKVKSLRSLRGCLRRSTGLVKSATEHVHNQRASTHRDRNAWQPEFAVSVALGSDADVNRAEVEAFVWTAAQHADHGMKL